MSARLHYIVQATCKMMALLALAASSLAAPAPQTAILQRSLAGPMKEVNEVIFCTRLRYDDPHWYANIGYYCDDENKKAYTGNGSPDASKLFKLNLRTGKLEILLDAKGGSIRDPQVHYDGHTILFSYRPAGTDYYHLYEIQADGTGLRQITSGNFDDFEATYLPDDDILFISTRCKRWVNCWMTQVGIMYRCDRRGQNIEVVSANTEHDNTPWVMPDGRVLYTRWEYVDRSQVEYHHLWVMNPDGTGATIYFGNMHPGVVMIDAKPVPGTDLVVASFSPGHGVNEHNGIATLVGPQQGPDAKTAARPLHKGKLTRDPFPFATNCVMAAMENKIVLLDGSGTVETIYTHDGPGLVHEPRPLVPRQREGRVVKRTHPQSAAGLMILADIYNSRNLPGVQRGEIKKLLVLESLPKPVNFSGGMDLTSWLGTFTLERVLGTVPVEPDGSAYFEVPAGRSLFFVALDGRDLSVKRMQSFTDVMPGETLSCVGCHEQRVKTPENKYHGTLMALKRPPSRIEPFANLPDVLDFHRDIQPILDRYCTRCHNYDKREAKLILCGDIGPNWAHSYFSLFAHGLVSDGRNGLGNQPPRSIGSSASRLLKILEKYKPTPQEWRTIWMWIESGAPYAGTYAGLRNAEQQAASERAAGTVFQGCREVLQRRCATCHKPQTPPGPIPMPFNVEERRKQQLAAGRPTGIYERIVHTNDPIARLSSYILLNFTRPEKSPLLLGPLAREAGGFGSCGDVFKNTSDADYRLLLDAIKRGKTIIEASHRYGTPEFRPNRQYVREMKRFGILPADFNPDSTPINVFEIDQQYWRSLWPASQPPLAMESRP